MCLRLHRRMKKFAVVNAAGTHLAGSWRWHAALLLMTPAAVPFRCSSLSVLRPNQRPVYLWLQKLIDTRSKTESEKLFTQWQDLFPVFLSTNLLVRGHSCVSSHIVSSENPCCVPDRPRKHRRVCCRFKRRDFVFENCQICSSESTHCGDCFLSCFIAMMAVPVTLVVEFASLLLQDDILLPPCPVATEELLLFSPCRQKRSYTRSRTHFAVAATT